MKYIITLSLPTDDNREHAVYNGEDSCVVWDTEYEFDGINDYEDLKESYYRLKQSYPDAKYTVYKLEEYFL